MQTERQDDLGKVLDDQINRVYELYQSKSKSFRKSFLTLFSFALLFLFVILIPYVSIKARNSEISERLRDLSGEITEQETHFKTYKNAQLGIEKFQKQIANGPADLRKFLIEIQSQDSPSPQHIQDQSGEPGQRYPGTNEDLDTLVSRELQSQFFEYQRILLEEVVEPLESLDKEGSLPIDQDMLRAALDDLKIAIDAKFAETPRFWETFLGKEMFYTELGETIGQFWSDLDSVINEQSSKLETGLDDLQDEKGKLDRELAELETQETKIQGRLSQIEFPLGKIPIGLNESVAMFPVFLAIGFWICTSLLLETIRLRRSLHTLYQKQDASRAILTDDQIALLAPLWIDPANPKQNRVIQFAIFSVPFLIFIVACGLVFYSWTIPNLLAGSAQFNWWMYSGIYALSLGIFIYGYGQIIMELLHYSRE